MWNKQIGTAAYTAGRWYDTSFLYGYPTSETFPGTALTSTLFTSTNNPGFMPTGGNVSPSQKTLTTIEAFAQNATSVPMWLLLVDQLMYYPQINLDTNLQQTLINTVTLPRYTSGSGVMMYFNVTAGTTGATATAIHPTGFNYTNSYGTNGRVIPGTVAFPASAIVPSIPHAQPASQNTMGPFLPLDAADQGVQSVQNVQFTVSCGTVCTVNLILCKPIAAVPISTVWVPQGRNFIFDMPYMPRIYDGACLNFLLFSGVAVAASQQINAMMSFIWG
jgi:hypothetical protein